VVLDPDGTLITEKVDIPAHTVRIFANGDLAFSRSFAITGCFLLTNDAQGFRLGVNGTIALGPLGTMALDGSLIVNQAGVVATLQLGGGTRHTLDGIGFSLGAMFQLEINTTGSAQTISRFGVNPQTGAVSGSHTVTIAAGTVRVYAGGSLNLAGSLSIHGRFELTVASEGLTIHLDAMLNMFGSYLTVSGSAGIVNDGIVINLTLKSGQSTSCTLRFAGISMTGTFTLQVNTTSRDIHDVSAKTVRIEAAGLEVFLLGFTLKGNGSIEYQGGVFRMDNLSLSLDFLNFIYIQVQGNIGSDGSYYLHGSAGFKIGDDFFGAGGDITVTLCSSGTFDLLFSAWGKIFGFGFGPLAGRIRLVDGHGWLDVEASVTLFPAFRMWVLNPPYILPWVGRWVDVPALVVSYRHSFYLGSLGTPAPPLPPPALATRFPDGTLRLNLGADASWRATDDGITDEVFLITYVSGEAGNETVAVTALGHTVQYTGVARIVATDAGSGNDIIEIGAGIRADAFLGAGEGNNQLIYRGSGSAVLTGGLGEDLLIGGSGPAVITSLGGPDTIHTASGNGTIHVIGDDPRTIYSDGGTVTIYAAGALEATVVAEHLVARSHGAMRLTTTVASLDVETHAPGAVAIIETDDLELSRVVTADGPIAVLAEEALTAAWVQSLSSSPANTIELRTTAGPIRVGEIDAGPAGAVILQAAGEIMDLAGTIMADELIVTADGAISLNTTVNRLTVSTPGAVTVVETDGILVNPVVGSLGLTTEYAGDVSIVASDDLTVVGIQVADGTLDLQGETLTITGSVVANDMTVSAGKMIGAGGSGILMCGNLVATAGTGMTLTTAVDEITARVTGTGDLVIHEAGAIVLQEVHTANGSITVTAGGTIVALEVSCGTDSGENDISLTATGGDIEVGHLHAGVHGDLALTASGSILDRGGMIVADELTVTAAGSITLVTTIRVLTATSSGAGDVIVTETDDIVLHRIRVAQGAFAATAGGGITATHVESLTDAAAHDVRLTATTGDILIDLVQAGRHHGRVYLVAAGDVREVAEFDADVDLRARYAYIRVGGQFGCATDPNLELELDVSTLEFYGPYLVLHHQGDIELISTVPGTIDVQIAGTIIATCLISGQGRIQVVAGADLRLGYADAGAQGGVVNLTAAGSIYALEPADDGVNLIAWQANLFAGAHIGGGSQENPYLKTAVEILVAEVGGSTIYIDESDDIELVSIVAPGGEIGIVAGGDIFITGRVTTGAAAGSILMKAGGCVYMEGHDPVVTDFLDVTANSGIFLRTAAAWLDAGVEGEGILEIQEEGSVVLRNVTNTNGPIRVLADGSITAIRVESLTDAKGNNVGLMTLDGDILVDYVGVGIEHGQISLSSAGDIREWGDGDEHIDLKGALGILYAQGSIDQGLDRSFKPIHPHDRRIGLLHVLAVLFGRGRTDPGWNRQYALYEFERGEMLNLPNVAGDVEVFFSLTNKVHISATGTISVIYLDSPGHDVHLNSKYADISVEYLNAGSHNGSVRLKARGSISLAGQPYSGDAGQIISGNLCIAAGQRIVVYGNVDAGGNVSMASRGGDIDIQSRVVAGGKICIRAAGHLTISAPVEAASSLNLRAGGSLRTTDASATLTAGMGVALKTRRGDIELSGMVTSGTEPAPSNPRRGWRRQAKPDVAIEAAGAFLAHGSIISYDDVKVRARDGVIIESVVTAAHSIRIRTGGCLATTEGTALYAGRDITLSSRGPATISGTIGSGGAVRIASSADMLISGEIKVWDDLRVSSRGDIVFSGSVEAGNAIQLSARGDLNLLSPSTLTGLDGEEARLVRLITRREMILAGTIEARKVIIKRPLTMRGLPLQNAWLNLLP
jgi:hypothetical protein